MYQTEAEIRRTDETSERVVFTCGGCGRETVIHVGVNTFLSDKRCGRCRGSERFGRSLPAPTKGRTGTHRGRRTGENAVQQRATSRAASVRNAQHKSGYRMSNGLTGRMPCRSYDQCNHEKHRTAQGRR